VLNSEEITTMPTPTIPSQDSDTVAKAIHVSRQLLALFKHQQKWDDGKLSPLTIRLPRSLLLNIRERAIHRGVSISEVIRTALS
jgi:hypothetical protein